MELAPGSRLGPYEIVKPIGSGGMGEVWLARDTRLNRAVAIKRAQQDRNARFNEEARAIAALNHPHICTLYDIGPDYLVMEYVEGFPLHGPMPIDQVSRLAKQVASALDAAHEKGILHRDLKPANVMVNGETAKLLDFGIAKIIHDDTPDRTLTAAGSIIGTIAYMSPEQAQGHELDQRSDVFSFGALLYEMVSGHRAFSGASNAEILAAILRDEPAPFPMPDAIARVVQRCLRKKPADRFQRMADVLAALDDHRPLEKTPVATLAVLPFADTSPEKDGEYFGDGLSDEVINALTRVHGLKVIARTSSFAFKSRPADIRAIAGTLGVGHVLEGSVRRAGSRIRVTAQLIRAADGSPSWSERYDRELTDVFGVQDEIAAAITGALTTTLAKPRAPKHTPTPEAYELCLKGRFYQFVFTAEGQARCREYYTKAIAADPLYAPSHHGLALHYSTLAIFNLMPAHEAMPLSRRGEQTALTLDPDLPEAHGGLGQIAALYDYNWEEAARCFERGISSGPVPPAFHATYAYTCLWPSGRIREAVDSLTRALSSDPLSTAIRYRLAVLLMSIGREEDAVAHLQKILEFDERSRIAMTILSLYYESRDMAAAMSYSDKALALEPRNPIALGVHAALLIRSGQTERGQAMKAALEQNAGHYGVPLGLMTFYLLGNDVDLAAEWTRRAIEQRTPGVLQFVYLPMSAPLRDSAHWPALAREMNLTHEQSTVS